MSGYSESRRGIAFDYEGNPRDRSRDPRRGPNRRQQQRREEIREKRKVLWSGKTPSAGGAACAAAGSGRGGVGGGSGSDDSDSSSDAGADGRGLVRFAANAAEGAAEHAGGSFNGWEQTSFDSSSDKEKFLRMMGAKNVPLDSSAPDRPASAAAPGGASDRQRDRELEQQYLQGVKRLGGRQGLGG